MLSARFFVVKMTERRKTQSEEWTDFTLLFIYFITVNKYRFCISVIGYINVQIIGIGRSLGKHLWREPQIIKLENAFHIWINIGYICERTLSAMSRVKSRFCARLTDCFLQSLLLLLSSRISQNWSAPDSIRCFINDE